MAYSVMYDPNTGKAIVQINADDLARITGHHTVMSMHDLLSKIFPKRKANKK